MNLDVIVLPVVPAVCDRAAQICLRHGFKPLDALHLAAAVPDHPLLRARSPGTRSYNQSSRRNPGMCWKCLVLCVINVRS